MNKKALIASLGNLKVWMKSPYVVAYIILVLSVMVSVFVRTPFAFQDEQTHYVRAIGISNGQLLSYSRDGDMSRLGHDVDSSQSVFIDKYLYDNSRVSLKWLGDKTDVLKLSGKSKYLVNTNTAPYTPVSYVPYAIGARIATVFTNEVRYQFIVMRVFGAILSLLIVFLALKVAPRKMKWVILAIAMLPMSLATFAAISADGFEIAISLLFMAWLMNMIEKVDSKGLQSRDIGVLGAISLLLVTAKMPVFLLVALVLALMIFYRDKISSRHKLYLLLILVLSAAFTLIWAYYARNINTGAYWGRNVDTAKQLHYIASAPVLFLENLLYSVLNYDYLNVTYQTYANAAMYMNIPWVFEVLLITGVFMGSFVESENMETDKRQFWMYVCQIAIFVLVSLTIFLLLYLQFTPIGTSNRIDGVQPRYFLPYLVLLCMSPLTIRLSKAAKHFVYTAPFIGVFIYFAFIAKQLA